MPLIPGNAQHLGARRDQQDAFAFSDPSATEFIRHAGFLAVLADGMGGLAHGASASRVAVKAFHRAFSTKAQTETIPDALQRSLREANQAVLGMGQDTGTTLVASVIHESNLYWISVGDSALFLCRDRRLTLLTTAHTYAQELEAAAAAGQISTTEARAHPERDSLTSYLGQKKLEEIDYTPAAFPLTTGDRFLLASDGLFKTLAPEEIESAITADAQASCDELIRRVLARNKKDQDNVTVLIVGLA
jgi:protein phosphatase